MKPFLHTRVGLVTGILRLQFPTFPGTGGHSYRTTSIASHGAGLLHISWIQFRTGFHNPHNYFNVSYSTVYRCTTQNPRVQGSEAKGITMAELLQISSGTVREQQCYCQFAAHFNCSALSLKQVSHLQFNK